MRVTAKYYNHGTFLTECEVIMGCFSPVTPKEACTTMVGFYLKEYAAQADEVRINLNGVLDVTATKTGEGWTFESV